MFDHSKLLSKYIVLFMTVIFLIALFFFYRAGADRNRLFSVEIISAEQAAEICSMPLNPNLLEEQNSLLLFNGVPLPLDEETHTYYMSQNMNTHDWQGALSLSNKRCGLYFSEDSFLSDKADAIRSGHIFSLYVKNDISYQPISLVITGLPLVSMNTSWSEEPVYDKDLDPDNYYYNSQTRYYGDISIFNANPQTGKCQTVSSSVRFNERGFSSSGYARKKNYTVKLLDNDGSGNKKYLFDMDTNDKWKLINLYNDNNKIRDKTSLTLWQEIAENETQFSEYGAKMQYCEVILDGRYNGLYGVLYPIDSDTLRLKEGDSLYKIIEFGNPSPDSFQYSLDNQFSVAYPVRLRYPKEPEKFVAGWMPYQEYLTHSVWQPNAYAFSELLDLRNAADFQIFIQATAASDNCSKNTYLVSKKQPDGKYTTYIIPWDLNYTFGEVWIGDAENLNVTINEDVTVIYEEPYIRQLFDENINGANDILKERYAGYRKSILSDEHIISIMEENMNLLVESGALARDTAICPPGNSSDLTWTKEYVKARMAFLDEYFLGAE